MLQAVPVWETVAYLGKTGQFKSWYLTKIFSQLSEHIL